MLWKPVTNLNVGFMLAAPTMKLHGTADAQMSYITGRYEQGLDDFLTARVSNKSGDSFFRIPLHLRLGVSYTIPKKATFSVDFSYYASDHYRRLGGCDTSAGDCRPTFYDDIIQEGGFVNQVNREHTWNVNIGIEVYPWSLLPVRVGFFTNRSSAPDIDETSPDVFNQLTKIDYYGITFSMGYLGTGYNLNFGVNVAFGSGRTIMGGRNVTRFVTDVNETLIYFYFAGAISAAKKLVVKAAKAVAK